MVAAILVKGPAVPDVLRHTWYPARPLPPASVDAVQVRFTFRFAPVAESDPGAVGGVPGVAATATFEGAEEPPAFVATTR